jgi:Lipase (class 3)
MKIFYTLLFFLLSSTIHAQLKPGFDAKEYLELLRVSKQQADDTLKNDLVPKPKQYHMIYRSPEGPLKNRWDLWINDEGIAVISIRGTINSNISWLENFYAAMVPATGQLHINDSTSFNYHLAGNSKATVHIGWLLGMAYLSKTIVPQIKQLYQSGGTKNFIIMGHSQGAAIAFLLRSFLADQQTNKLLPSDIIFKTYCSAPPKPGNIWYAYDYNYLTRGGWGLTIINAADWVPQTPFSIQTLNDLNTPNPFTDVNKSIRKQPFFVRLYIKHVYNRLKNTPEKAQKTNEKYLGKLAYKFIKKQMPQFTEPVYAQDNNYASTGTPIILMPDDDYRARFPSDPKKIFIHHLFWPYYYLTEKEYLNQQ